jgi:hypothetical protein
VERLDEMSRALRRAHTAERAVDALKQEMARLGIVRTHFDFHQFVHDFMPREIRVKVPLILCFNFTGYFDGRCGVVVGILAYYARGRGFDSRTVQTFVCMNMSVLSGCLYV